MLLDNSVMNFNTRRAMPTIDFHGYEHTTGCFHPTRCEYILVAFEAVSGCQGWRKRKELLSVLLSTVLKNQSGNNSQPANSI